MKLTTSKLQQIINEEFNTILMEQIDPTWVRILQGKTLLRQGHRGPKVKYLQRLLIRAKHLPVGEDDGIFGADTKTAVKEFQKKAFPKKRQEWDGIVGKNTATALQQSTGALDKKDDDGWKWPSLSGMISGAERMYRGVADRPQKGTIRKVNGIAVAWPNYKPHVSKTGWMKHLHDMGMKKAPIALGHAGVVLINNKGYGVYFDFGRYSGAEPGNGIVRGPYRVRVRAIWDKNGDLKNKEQFLIAIKGTKGARNYDGEMMSALIRNVNYKSAYNFAASMKGKKIPYNLAQSITTGENCATFVAEVMEAGGAGSWASSMRKQFVALPASIVETLANEEDEEVITV